jgi:hypothetical protein
VTGVQTCALPISQTSLATQHRFTRDIQLQPRFALIVPPAFEPNRQESFRRGQHVCQARQSSQGKPTIQHTTTARELEAVYNRSGN